MAGGFLLFWEAPVRTRREGVGWGDASRLCRSPGTRIGGGFYPIVPVRMDLHSPRIVRGLLYTRSESLEKNTTMVESVGIAAGKAFRSPISGAFCGAMGRSCGDLMIDTRPAFQLTMIKWILIGLAI